MNLSKQKFLFPCDIVGFGKFKGCPISEVARENYSYYRWMKENGATFSVLIDEYAKGNDLLQPEIKVRVKSSTDTLIIERNWFYILPHIHGVHKSKRSKNVKSELLQSFKIEVPFKIETVITTRTHYGNGLQSDDREWHTQEESKVKVYDKEMLSDFISQKLKEI